MPRRILGALFIASLAMPSTTRSQSTPAVASDSLGHFPQVTGENLAGKRFDLPREFEGDLAFVVVAFKRNQQHDVDSWMPFLKKLTRGRTDVRVYEIPTLGRGYRFMRPMIDGGMRRGIPDPAVRAATITLYIDKTPFRRALRLQSEDSIYVLLVDRDGGIHARASGPFDAAAAASLKQALDAIPITSRGIGTP